MKAMTVAALIASMAVTTVAQAQTYKWEDGLCAMKGDFDSKKYTAKQIENSHLVLESLTRLNLESFFPPMDIDALDKLSMKDMDLLNKEYKQAKSDIERLDVVPEAKGYKQELLKSIDGEYKQNQLTILAYLDPSEALKQSPPMCHQYIKPLLQNESAVQSKWKQLVEKRALSNSYAMSRYQEQKASNPAKYAKIDLITFGFGSCVNEQIYHADSEVVFKNQQKLNKTLFGKSFKQVCDEP